MSARDVASAGLTRSDLLLPAMTMRASAATHNLTLQAQWLESLGATQAPHAKTHLSPEIVAAQLAAGAWGMTVASVHQARLVAAYGATRILIAQQVVDAASLAALHQLRSAHADLSVALILDSEAGLEAAAASVNDASAAPLEVLIELGIDGGRSGVRSTDEAMRLGRLALATPHLVLTGVEGFEGILSTSRGSSDVARVRAFLATLTSVTRAMDKAGLFAQAETIVLTAGGSSFPDLAAEMHPGTLSRPHLVVVRSGGTVVHDYGELSTYAPLSSEQSHPLGELRPALEVWAAVTSQPEPGVALIACGKRDLPYDAGLPKVLEILRNGEALVSSSPVSVSRLNDQHGFITFAADATEHPRVGDVIRLGPLHPCTAFDKWAVIPVLDDADTVIGVARTYF